MQYLALCEQDLLKYKNVYVLRLLDDRIGFTVVCKGARTEADALELAVEFWDSGFDGTISAMDENILTPMYTDIRGYEIKDVHNVEKKIFKDKATIAGFNFKRYIADRLDKATATIAGFKFKPGVTDLQKIAAFKTIVDCFVSTSKQLGSEVGRNVFVVVGNYCPMVYDNGGSKEVVDVNYVPMVYDNGGSKETEIRGADIMESLGFETAQIRTKQQCQKVMADAMTKQR